MRRQKRIRFTRKKNRSYVRRSGAETTVKTFLSTRQLFLLPSLLIDNRTGRTPHTDITNQENESETSFILKAPLATAPEEESICGGLDFPIRRQPKREEREKTFRFVSAIRGYFPSQLQRIGVRTKKVFCEGQAIHIPLLSCKIITPTADAPRQI